MVGKFPSNNTIATPVNTPVRTLDHIHWFFAISGRLRVFHVRKCVATRNWKKFSLCSVRVHSLDIVSGLSRPAAHRSRSRWPFVLLAAPTSPHSAQRLELEETRDRIGQPYYNRPTDGQAGTENPHCRCDVDMSVRIPLLVSIWLCGVTDHELMTRPQSGPRPVSACQAPILRRPSLYQ